MTENQDKNKEEICWKEKQLKDLLFMIKYIIKQKEDMIEVHCKCHDGYVPDIFGNSYHRCTVCNGSLKIKVTKIQAIKKYMKILFKGLYPEDELKWKNSMKKQ